MFNQGYQEQTKKKQPLILNHKMKNDPPTVLLKDKKHKDKSKEKQNEKINYDYQKLKHKQFKPVFTHFNQNQQKKISYNPNQIPAPQPSIKTHHISFGTVRNTQNQLNKFATEKQVLQINFKIQNYGPQDNLDKKNKKFEQKPSILLKNTNQKSERNQKYPNFNKPDEKYTNFKPDEKYPNFNKPQEKYVNFKQQQKLIKQKNQRKQKFKKPLIQNISPANEKIDFYCDQQIDFKPVQKKNLALQKKISQKKLNQPLYQQQNNFVQVQNMPTISNLPHISTTQFQHQTNFQTNQSHLQLQSKPVIKKDKKSQQLKQIKQFQTKQNQININSQYQMMQYIYKLQDKYSMPSNYLEQSQKNISWNVRAILIDWMRQLSYEYSLKRDTYHLALTLLDNYMAKKKNLNKQKAQVIGATTLFIASKLQQLECRSSQDFADATQGICTSKDIKSIQIDICKTLQFYLNPPTFYSLANRLMTQWDAYLDEVDYAMHHLCFQGKQKVYFKKLDQTSYKQFRQLMQYIDCAILDIQTNQHKPLVLILSFMYLVIGLKLKNFQVNEVLYVFPKKSHYLMDENNFLNDLFQHFVTSSFSIELLELLATIQYCAGYFNLQLSWQKPSIQKKQQDLQAMNLEEYCSYQTYNRHMLKTVMNRYRGIVRTF